MTLVRWTLQAADDLEAIRDFIARDSEPYAALVVARILSAIDRPEEFPMSGRTPPEKRGTDLRELIEPPYRIVYRLAREAAHILTF